MRSSYLFPSIPPSRLLRAARVMTLVFVAFTLLPPEAHAWKPKHHIHTGNEAIAGILAGRDIVIIEGISYAIDPEIAVAIRKYPEYYRAGCIGPDGFPDLTFGQMIIHPDWKNEEGTSGTYTHEWLAHIHAAAWDYYESRNGNAAGQQALAFMYGFLTHAGGDLWGHTFINGFAGGSWPEIPDGDISIAIRHIIAEEYVAKRVPPTDMTVASPNDFIYEVFIASNASFQMGRDAAISDLFGIPYFRDLRNRLVATKSSLDCSPWPWDWLDCAKIAYLNAWIDDIDDGLDVWPEKMSEIGEHMFVDEDPSHMDDARDAFEQFAYDHLFSMYGAPDFVGGFLDDWDAVTSWVEDLIGIDIPGLGDLVAYYFEATYGIDFDELKEYTTHPENYIDQAPLFGPDTSARLDALMHTAGGEFDPHLFAANQNTITMAKMILLGPDQMNRLLEQYGVGPLYGGANDAVPAGMRENAMLGFIRTLDGDHQWRRTPIDEPLNQHSEGMPLWVDCQARELVFRSVFTDWEEHDPPGNFPDALDDCECWNDLPPTIAVEFNRDVLWPPNHKMAVITADVTVEDDCDENPTFALVSITSNEQNNGQGDGNTKKDIEGADFGTPDVEFELRAERSGGGDGRIYTITYEARDVAGNSTTADFYIRVVHDQSGRAMPATCVMTDETGRPDWKESVILVIPSATDQLGEVRPGVMQVDPGRTRLGNLAVQVSASLSRTTDATGDGVEDLILAFPGLVDLIRKDKPDPDDQEICLRYEDSTGKGYLVEGIFALGEPLQLWDCPTGPDSDRAVSGLNPALVLTELVEAWPNPFNPSTTISYVLAAPGRTRLDIHDLRGVLVVTLKNEMLEAGRHETVWDGRNNRGGLVSSGVYFVRLVTPEVRQTMKVLLIK